MRKLGARVWGLVGLVVVVGLVVGCGGNGAKATATVGASPVTAPTATATPGVMMVQMVTADSNGPSKGATLLYVVTGGLLIVGALWGARTFLNVKKTEIDRRRVRLVIAIECLVMVGCYLLVQPIGKTLWEWLDLLVVPAILAFGGLWFSRLEREAEKRQAIAERKAEDRRADVDRDIVEDRQQADALQMYLDRMTELLLEKELLTSEKKEVRDVARVRTLAVLRGLNGIRKGELVKFLYEAGLIFSDNTAVDLSEADLIKADLIRAKLNGAYLSRAYLINANLALANLSGAVLSGAVLSGADLISANLNGADLSEANLHGVTLGGADLSGANLSGAINVSYHELSLAESLEGATLPDGTIYHGLPIYLPPFPPPSDQTPAAGDEGGGDG